MYRVSKKKWCVLICFLLIFFVEGILYAKEVSYTLEDRDRLITIESKVDLIDKRFEQIDKRFEQIDKRFEQIDKRFEQVYERFEQIDIRFEELRDDMNRRFEELFTFLWIITGIFTAITISTISLTVWDRRTVVRPFETKVSKIEKRIEEIDKGKVDKLIMALREISSTDARVKEVLKRFHLL